MNLAFRNSGIARAVWGALKPEEGLPGSARCRVNVERMKNVLCLEMDADDPAALRAALNSFLRLAAVARDMIEGKGR